MDFRRECTRKDETGAKKHSSNYFAGLIRRHRRRPAFLNLCSELIYEGGQGMEARTNPASSHRFLRLPGASPFPAAVSGHQRPSAEYQPRRTSQGGPRSHCLHGAAPRGTGCSPGPADPLPTAGRPAGLSPTPRAWPARTPPRAASRPRSPGGPRRAPGKWSRQRLPGTQISPFPDLEGQAAKHSPRQPLGPPGALRTAAAAAAACPGATLLSRTLRAAAAPAARARGLTDRAAERASAGTGRGGRRAPRRGSQSPRVGPRRTGRG